MNKQWYTVTFNAKMSEEDVKAMYGCFYQAMEEALEKVKELCEEVE